jgi:hypothetical protein
MADKGQHRNHENQYEQVKGCLPHSVIVGL